MDATDVLHGLTPPQIAALCAVSQRTARRWKRTHQVPPIAVRYLRLIRRGELGALHPAWANWTLQAGEIHSPEGWGYTPAEVLGLRIRAQLCATLERQVRALLSLQESDQERRERLGAVLRLVSLLERSRRELEALRSSFSPHELASVAARVRLSGRCPGG